VFSYKVSDEIAYRHFLVWLSWVRNNQIWP
jgi:hypothetical protein